MSKQDGQYVVVKFTQDLIGDVSGYDPLAGYEKANVNTITTITATSSSDSSTSYSADKAIDGDTTTCWRPGVSASSYIVLNLGTTQVITGLRMYMHSIYYWKDFTISGSNDNIDYTAIATLTETAGGAWKEYAISNTNSYLYYKVAVNTSNSSVYTYLYEIELLYDKPTGNEKAFTVTGQEYKWVPDGPLEDKIKTVKAVEPYWNINKNIDLSNGEKTHCVVTNGVLKLARSEET